MFRKIAARDGYLVKRARKVCITDVTFSCQFRQMQKVAFGKVSRMWFSLVRGIGRSEMPVQSDSTRVKGPGLGGFKFD